MQGSPFKQIQNIENQPSKGFNERSSEQITNNYLNKMLNTYREKSEYFRKKNDQLTKQIYSCKTQINQKDRQIQAMSQQISKLTIDLQNALKHHLQTKDEVKNQRRVVSSHQIQNIRSKQEFQKNQKINKVLTTQNHILVTKNTQLKQQINLLTNKLEEIMIQLQGSNKKQDLLCQMNEDLKLEVEQLIFQLKTLNRRKDTSRLLTYEAKLEERQYLEQVAYKNNEEYTGQEGTEIIGLLQQRIQHLEHQLIKAEERCKNLQTIILSSP